MIGLLSRADFLFLSVRLRDGFAFKHCMTTSGLRKGQFCKRGLAAYLSALVEYVTDLSFLRPGYLGDGIKKSAPSLRRILTVKS